MDLFPAHQPGKFCFHHQPAAKLDIFFFNLSRLISSCFLALTTTDGIVESGVQDQLKNGVAYKKKRVCN